jgi:branched-chain amino acid transport system substrate-binding protein
MAFIRLNGQDRMTSRTLLLCTVIAVLVASVANANSATVKIGLIMPYSGVFADAATQVDAGIKLYMSRHGNVIAGKKIEIVRRDVGGINPSLSKRIARDLVVREHVHILAGFALTPNALAAADVSRQAKIPLVIMNAATSIITTKSPYAVRVSMTLAQITAPFGTWVARHGIKDVYVMVSDYGPGHDAEKGFVRTFTAAGGKVVGSVRMPVADPDFSPFVQRAKDSKAQAVFIFVPAGSQPAAMMKSLFDHGMTPDKVKILGSGGLTDDSALKGVGDEMAGVLTAYHYDHSHSSALNAEFVEAFRQEHKGVNPDIQAVGGYDGMHLIYAALKKTGGNPDGQAFIDAAKGMRWESPRGMIEIDPQTRDIVQTIYIRRLENVNGKLQNVEIDKFENVKDPVKEEMRKK